MRVLVTGHDGYIGSVLLPYLAERGIAAAGLDSFYFAGCTLGLGRPQAQRETAKDVRDLSVEDLGGFDAVIHLAALSNDPLGELNAHWTRDINVHGTVHLARLARDAGVPRFVLSSSCSLYGLSPGDQAVDESAELRPITEYARSKVEAEVGLRQLACESFSPVFMRNATVYGISPHFRIDLVVNNLAACAHATGKISLMTDGTPWRPLVHVLDLCQAFATVLEAPRDTVHNTAFNVGVQGENYRVRDVAQLVRAQMPDCAVTYAANAGPDPRSYRVDFRRFARAFPRFSPEWSVARGVHELLDGLGAAAFSQSDFSGSKYVRLKHLRQLIEAGLLDSSLRWRRI